MNSKTTPADDIWKDELSYDEYIEKRLDELSPGPTTLGTATPLPPQPFPTTQKFNEDQYLDEIRDYLAGTYKAHYATGSVQAFELIDSAGLSEGFTMGSVIKYASRYGKKNGHNRKDLMKIIHYSLLQLWVHDQTNTKEPKMAKTTKKKPAAKKLSALKPVKRAKKKTTPKKAAVKDLSVYILLDRSGSMQNLWDEALTSINTYVHALDGSTKATMAVFDSGGFDMIRDTTAAQWTDVGKSDAHPRGMTPLYDAAGKILDRMYADDPKSGVLVIMTDGYENASSEYTRTNILSRIEAAKKDKNWQVIFLGAEFNDVGAVSSSLGVAKGQTVNMTAGNLGATMRGLATYTTSYAATGAEVFFNEADRVTAGEIKVNPNITTTK